MNIYYVRASTAGNGMDATVIGLLEGAGHVVTQKTVDAAADWATRDFTNQNLIIISETLSSGNIGINGRDTTIPVLLLEGGLAVSWQLSTGSPFTVDDTSWIVTGGPSGLHASSPLVWQTGTTGGSARIQGSQLTATAQDVYGPSTGLHSVVFGPVGATYSSDRLWIGWRDAPGFNLTAAGSAWFLQAVSFLDPLSARISAGDDQTVEASSGTITLSATATPTGGTYAWTQTGTAVTLSDATAASPTFDAPSTAGSTTFTVTYTPAVGDPVSDDVTITYILPVGPSLTVGTLSEQKVIPFTASPDTTVTLTHTSGPAPTDIIGPTDSAFTVTLPTGFDEQTVSMVLTLTATDAFAQTDSETVTIVPSGVPVPAPRFTLHVRTATGHEPALP